MKNIFKAILIISICLIISLLLGNCASRWYLPQCGDELRIDTRDSTIIHGKLIQIDSITIVLQNNNVLEKQQIFPKRTVVSVYQVQRRTEKGVFFGFLAGTTTGLILGISTLDYFPGLFPNASTDERSNNKLALITAGGAIIGSIVGGLIGHKSLRYHKVKLEAIPMCSSQFGDKFLLKVNFAFSF